MSGILTIINILQYKGFVTGGKGGYKIKIDADKLKLDEKIKSKALLQVLVKKNKDALLQFISENELFCLYKIV